MHSAQAEFQIHPRELSVVGLEALSQLGLWLCAYSTIFFVWFKIPIFEPNQTNGQVILYQFELILVTSARGH